LSNHSRPSDKISKVLLPSFEEKVEAPPIIKAKEERKASPPPVPVSPPVEPAPPELPVLSPADIEKGAYEKGFEEGRRAGMESVEKETAELLDGLHVAIAEVGRMREQLVRDVEPQVVQLALAVARRILADDLADNSWRVVGIVKEAIRRINRLEAVTIRVHPEMADIISSLKGRSSEFQTEILLDIDSTVPVNGPVVVGATEEVMTDIDEQIRVIAEDLRSERASR